VVLTAGRKVGSRERDERRLTVGSGGGVEIASTTDPRLGRRRAALKLDESWRGKGE
jgi:hypothetical protein